MKVFLVYILLKIAKFLLKIATFLPKIATIWRRPPGFQNRHFLRGESPPISGALDLSKPPLWREVVTIGGPAFTYLVQGFQFYFFERANFGLKIATFGAPITQICAPKSPQFRQI